MTYLDPTQPAILTPPWELPTATFESVRILKTLNRTSRLLGELKGTVARLPNPSILIDTLGMQEAKDSSEIETIVTTHDTLFMASGDDRDALDPRVKEVQRYREALHHGFKSVREDGILGIRQILAIQRVLEANDAGFRRTPGTRLVASGSQRVVYTPPQNHEEILRLMDELEKFINTPDMLAVDPLIKMALIHYQFESIHPFYDGNGRTGRILNVLYLVKEGLLDYPVLYHSRAILKSKGEYYRLLNEVRSQNAWEDWVCYLLKVVADTSEQAIRLIGAIFEAFVGLKRKLRDELKLKFYSQDLLNALFRQPYIRAAYLERELGVTFKTSARYLETLAEAGVLERLKVGRKVYYVHRKLMDILVQPDTEALVPVEQVQTVHTGPR